MIRKAKYLMIYVSLFLSLAINAQTTQPEGVKSRLTFEKSGEKVGLYMRGRSLDPVIPDYAAVMELQDGGYFEKDLEVGRQFEIWHHSPGNNPLGINDLGGYNANVWKEKVKETRFWPLMSENQRHYIQTSDTGGFNVELGRRSFEKDKGKYGIHKVSLFAVSEKDAQLMANALVVCLNKLHDKKLNNLQKGLAQYTRWMQEGKNRIATLNDDLKKTKAEVSTLQATFHYTNPESAYAEFVEMDKLVRVIGIDIAGAGARMEAIKEIEEKNGGKNQILLDQKRVDLNIEMAGLLARKKATEEDRDQAKKYYDRLKQVETSESSLEMETKKLKHYTDTVTLLKEKSANPTSMMKPVIVVENKAVIHPVNHP
jgi:hypothetical protein